MHVPGIERTVVSVVLGRRKMMSPSWLCCTALPLTPAALLAPRRAPCRSSGVSGLSCSVTCGAHGFSASVWAEPVGALSAGEWAAAPLKEAAQSSKASPRASGSARPVRVAPQGSMHSRMCRAGSPVPRCPGCKDQGLQSAPTWRRAALPGTEQPAAS